MNISYFALRIASCLNLFFFKFSLSSSFFLYHFQLILMDSIYVFTFPSLLINSKISEVFQSFLSAAMFRSKWQAVNFYFNCLTMYLHKRITGMVPFTGRISTIPKSISSLISGRERVKYLNRFLHRVKDQKFQ